MIWSRLNETMWHCEYVAWSITKQYQFTDQFGKDRFLFVATKDLIKYEGASWEYIKRKILKTHQATLWNS